MPLNTQIPLQSQTMNIQPAIQNYMAAQQNRRQQSLADLTLSNAEKEAERKRKVQEIETSFFNNPKGKAQAYQLAGMPEKANEVVVMARQAEKARITKMDNEQKWMGDQSSTVLGSKNRAEAWPLMKTQAINRGVRGAETWPDQYNKGVEDQLNYMSLNSEMGRGKTSNIAGQVMYDEAGHPWLLSKDPANPFMKPYSVEGLETPKKFVPSKGFTVETIGKDQFLINKGTGERTRLDKDAKVGIAEEKLGIEGAKLGIARSVEERQNEKWMAEVNRERTKKGLKKAGTDLAAKTVVQDMGRGMQILEKNMEGLITTAAGPIGSVMQYLPASDADVLEKYATSVKSNISIDRLQAMREASPTGGALGQVPVQQQEYLMQLLGSLDVAQKAPYSFRQYEANI